MCRSFIASYIGNIVGALFVALPAVYFYLGDYHFTDAEVVEMENGNGVKEVVYVNDKRED